MVVLLYVCIPYKDIHAVDTDKDVTTYAHVIIQNVTFVMSFTFVIIIIITLDCPLGGCTHLVE